MMRCESTFMTSVMRNRLRPTAKMERVLVVRMIDNVQYARTIDMTKIAVVVTLPNEVRMYTYDFNWAFR